MKTLVRLTMLFLNQSSLVLQSCTETYYLLGTSNRRQQKRAFDSKTFTRFILPIIVQDYVFRIRCCVRFPSTLFLFNTVILQSYTGNKNCRKAYKSKRGSCIKGRNHFDANRETCSLVFLRGSAQRSINMIFCVLLKVLGNFDVPYLTIQGQNYYCILFYKYY